MDVNMPKDVTRYKSRVIANLTLRQFISLIASVVISGAFYFSFRHRINEDILSWIVMFIAIPSLAFGFIEHNGMPLEKYIFIVFRNSFVYPILRKYKEEENELEAFLIDIKKERERDIKLSNKFRRKKVKGK